MMPGKISTVFNETIKSDNFYIDELLDAIFCGIVVVDSQNKIVAYNDSAEEIFGKLKKDILGQKINDKHVLNELYRMVKAEKEGRFKINIDNKIVIANMKNISDNGKIKGNVFILHRSTDQNCVSQELIVTEKLYQEINAFIESSYDGILVTDKNGIVNRVNYSFERMFNLSRKDIVGKSVKQITDEGLYEKSAALKTILTLQTSTEMITKDNRKILATAKPIFNSNQKLESVVVNVRDITELEDLKIDLEYQQNLTNEYSVELDKIKKNQDLYPDVIMHSKEMQNVMDMVSMVAEFNTTVLITGDSGVGKEIVSLSIHNLSDRKPKPYIKVNCSAIPSTLFESEMFGYVEGAFTGAKSKGKKGFFEQANGGTLFLDEIGEIDIEMQSKLLRAIQDKEIQSVGSEVTKKIDVRILAATNKDLKEQINKGLFREDLFYRLNVVNIKIPSLSKRIDDIIPLLNFFLERLNKKYNRKKFFSREVYVVLGKYSWPGNIRELENLVEHLMVLVKEDKIEINHLPEMYHSIQSLSQQVNVNGILPMKEAVEMLEKQLLYNACQTYNTTREIANVLGINQSTVSRKIRLLLQND